MDIKPPFSAAREVTAKRGGQEENGAFLRALSAGVHFMQVSKWLGHSTFTLTLDVYGDYIPDEDGGPTTSRSRPGRRSPQIR